MMKLWPWMAIGVVLFEPGFRGACIREFRYRLVGTH
jgi:hypothetical protein